MAQNTLGVTMSEVMFRVFNHELFTYVRGSNPTIDRITESMPSVTGHLKPGSPLEDFDNQKGEIVK